MVMGGDMSKNNMRKLLYITGSFLEYCFIPTILQDSASKLHF